MNCLDKLGKFRKMSQPFVEYLFDRLEEALTVQLERDKLVKSLEEKKKRIAELESRYGMTAWYHARATIPNFHYFSISSAYN